MHRVNDDWGINWPQGVGLLPPGDPAGRSAPASSKHRAQAGWCYGSPGVARALYLAGTALKKSEYCELAESAIEAVLRRPDRARLLASPNFCHGTAGLLHIVFRFAHDTASSAIRLGATALTEQLLSQYEPESLLGFKTLVVGGHRVCLPGLLEGTPGVALALLAGTQDVEPGWDRIFLLS
jgi:lantibiotic biosynthesis protein